MKKLKKTIIHFRRKIGMDSEMNNSIEQFEKDLKSRTKEVETNIDLCDFLKMLQIAEYGNMGKTKAIMFAFGIGYLRGREDLRKKVLIHFYGSEVAENEC